MLLFETFFQGMIKISVVIPTLNSECTLDSTILSLVSQRNVNVKVIVVDSGSEDSTLDICDRWQIQVLYAEPGNIYRAINTGLSKLDTEWLAYINSDDWLYPNSLFRLTNYGQRLEADVVYGNCDFVDEEGRFVYSFASAHPKQLLSLFQAGIFGFAQQGAIFRRSLYESLSGFDETYQLIADADFYFRALKKNVKFARLQNPSAACFRIHENQLSNCREQEMQAENFRLRPQTDIITSVQAWTTLTQWRFSNLPHYMLRLFRQSLLSNKLKVTSSMKAYNHLTHR